MIFYGDEKAHSPKLVRLERVTGVEPVSSPWQGDIIAVIRYPRMRFQKSEDNILIHALSVNYF